MAKRTRKKSAESQSTASSKRTPKKLTSQQKFIFGSLFMIIGILLMVSFLSFIFTGKADQSVLSSFPERTDTYKNWGSQIGAWASALFISEGFGIASFIIAGLIFLTGVYIAFNLKKKPLLFNWIWGALTVLWLSVFFGFFNYKLDILSGVIGYEINQYLQDYVGKIGVILLLTFGFVVYIASIFKVNGELILQLINNAKISLKKEANFKKHHSEKTPVVDNSLSDEADKIKASFNIKDNTEDEEDPVATTYEVNQPLSQPPISFEINKEEKEPDEDFKIEVKAPTDEDIDPKALAHKLVEDFGEFDPKLELSNYEFPPYNLLKKYDNQNISIDQNELEENKNKIVETLQNYKISITNIKATIGPTVTLYEIVPDAGVRISKIKNLEDDIALSLSALGIRIIAPIPGKGTIGIEVPNKKAKIVSMHSVIASKIFQQNKMELPIAFGKTISNETFVVDLAKMPHLLMAGATGQGKSVGLNAVLTSLLYKKHPAEVKFVLVDPKKVELTLFNKIERHYLAKLPDSEEAIITDNTKVIHTLNSLCIEMDNRYELLKNAFCRNIIEYNTKFKARELNPNQGHQFLPYIVLVVDEFADLIMTAGKEVETPIARLAQLARATGIHLIIATQRPSVNVITGVIKANFPARIAFRVTSKIDSRTILDNAGAEQLIGRGDMLYTQGNDVIRIQCAFVDTPEVESITEFIGSQKAYPDAHLLPEYIGEEGGAILDIDIEDRDKLFKEAAEVVVTAQQGSASLLQRKLKLGYNRAGRIIDQLEAAGVVGPFEGSKARRVLLPDLVALEQFLNNEQL